MTLWLRLLWAFVGAHFKGPVTPGAAHHQRFTVLPTEAGLRLAFSERYLGVAEVVRLEYMVRVGLFWTLLKKGWVPVIASSTVRYRRSLRRFQRYSVHTEVLGMDDEYFYFQHRFEHRNRVVAVIIAKGTVRDSQGIIDPSEYLSDVAISEPPAFVDLLNRAEKEIMDRARADAA
jgi:acyl-CoA thioesterase FadM